MSSSTSYYHFPQVSHNNTPPLVIAFTLILVVGFVFAFCIVHFCICFRTNFPRPTAPENLVHRSASASASTSPNRNGLDPLLLENFPSFPYSSVKEYRKEKYGLDCAICLLEFEEHSLLRFLTICCHVFHQECVDLWLMSHTTCPVCRSKLDSPINLKGKLLELSDIDRRSDSLADTDVVRIDVKDAGDDGNAGEREKQETSNRMEREEAEEDHTGKVLRSHSTGHSIVMIRGSEEGVDENDRDKYTLRLPEDAKVKLFRGGHHHNAQSWANL